MDWEPTMNPKDFPGLIKDVEDRIKKGELVEKDDSEVEEDITNQGRRGGTQPPPTPGGSLTGKGKQPA